jgi:hypothetical protein
VGHIIGLIGISFSPKRQNELTQKTAKVAQTKETKPIFLQNLISSKK